MATSAPKFEDPTTDADPSTLPEIPQPPPPPGTESDKVDASALPETKDEEGNTLSRVSDKQISDHLEKSDELPSYADLVRSGEVRVLDGSDNANLSYLNVCIQLCKFSGQQAIKTFNEYKDKGIQIPLGNVVTQALQMVKILAVIRVIITELQLSDDTYLYLQTASEYLGCQMLVRYAIMKKNPLMFKNSEDGTWTEINLVTRKYIKVWLKFAHMLAGPDFTKLSKEAKAAKIDIPNGEFHLMLFKLIDPDYSNHAGRRISRFVDKVFGTPSKKECVSGLCNLSPEAMKAIKYTCGCGESKYMRKKRERQAPGILDTHPLP